MFQRLSFSHFDELSGLEPQAKRTFYEQQCLKARWSVRELKRQISTLYYERTALSTDKTKLESQTLEKAEPEPLSFPVRGPYVFEFLGLKAAEVMGESELEDALLDKLQASALKPAKSAS